MKTRLIILVVALLVHCPLPCYDLDGENQGVPTHGIFDPAAWHVMLLGVLPENDIDRGPLKPQHQEEHGGGSAYDAPYVASAKIMVPDQLNCVYRSEAPSAISPDVSLAAVEVTSVLSIFRTFSASYSARSPQSWRQHLRMMLI